MLAGLIERGANGSDATVHHVTGRDDIRTGRGERDGGAGEQVQAGVVFYGELLACAMDDAAVAVRGVLA